MGPPLQTMQPRPVVVPVDTTPSVETKCKTNKLHYEVNEYSMVWKHVRNIFWGLTLILGILVFSMPVESLELVTKRIDISSQVSQFSLSNTTIVSEEPKDLAELYMRTFSVFILIATSAIPCMWCWMSRLMATFSMLLAVVYWAIVMGIDNFKYLEEWFAITFLVLIAVPFLLVAMDAVMKTRLHSKCMAKD